VINNDAKIRKNIDFVKHSEDSLYNSVPYLRSVYSGREKSLEMEGKCGNFASPFSGNGAVRKADLRPIKPLNL